MSRPRRSWVERSSWLRAVVGAGLLAAIVFWLGAGPFVAGFRAVTAWSLAAAAGIAVVTTVCSAWRWRVVAGRLGADIPLKSAVAAYYRAQFLNTTLPGGVLGDVHRGWRHGRDAGDVSLGLRAVVFERLAGQIVQAVIAVVVLVVMPSPLRSSTPVVLAGAVGGLLLLGAFLLRRRRAARRPDAGPRPNSTGRARDSAAMRAWAQVVAASAVVVAGYTSMFVLAARVAGVTVSTARLAPLALLVLLAMSVPANVGGWGPREGMAAWVFGAAGLGSALGLTTATVYGVLAFASCLPGGVVLLDEWLRRRRRIGVPTRRRWPAVSAQSKAGAGG